MYALKFCRTAAFLDHFMSVFLACNKPVKLPQGREFVTKNLDPCNVICHEQQSPVSNQPGETWPHTRALISHVNTPVPTSSNDS